MRDPLDLASLPVAELIERGRAAVKKLGIYEALLTKQERVSGSLLAPQKFRVIIRPEPLAIRVELLEGPGKGRKGFYSQAIDPNRIRGKEGGVLGFAGAMWVELRHPLVTRDTNHVITELGLGPLVEIVARDVEALKPAGGHLRPEPPKVEGGLTWLTFLVPPGHKGLFGEKTRVGIDPASGLILAAEASNAKGELLERVRYEIVKDRLPLPDSAFRPEAMGL